MGSPLADLAAQYSESYGDEVRSKDGIRQLYNRYVKERETSILDAVAAAGAVNAIVLSDQIDTNAITPQMREAFELAFPGRDLYERLEELNGLSPESRETMGFINNWKGKYFEVIARDKLNAGESLGDKQLGAGQKAQLFPDPTHPGSDLKILNTDGTIAEELQLKATDSLSYAQNALEKYPDITVVATDEAAAQVVDDLILESGLSNADLEAKITAPIEELLDGPLPEFAEVVLPGLPFVLIATTEGRKVLMGRQSFQQAMSHGLERSVKSGAAIAVGAVAALAGAGVLSLPAAFLTRIGIDRYRVQRGTLRRLHADADAIRALTPSKS